MKPENFCQSCSMPIDDPALKGAEKDGAKSNDYCTYCYQNGSFVNPNMTLNEMKVLVKEQMEKRKIDSNLISMALNSLPNLKRWRPKTVSI